jgi:choline-sulfatase
MKLRGLCATVGTPLLVVSIIVASCMASRETRPNVLLVTIDTLRPDHLSLYGSPLKETPAIDSLGHQGAVFDAAHCDVTWTTPSMASTMTGSYAIHHGFKSPYDRLSDANVTLAEILRGAGYQTAAIVGSYPLDSIYGLDQGFEVYDDAMTQPLLTGATAEVQPVESKRLDDVKAQQDWNFQKTINNSMRPDDQVTDAALALLASLRSQRRPFFLWVHYFGPHDLPDIALNVFENATIHVDTYADKVVRTDREIGRLIAGLGTDLDRMLVILHADHGESLGEHEFVGHGRYLFEDNLRVPLIVRWPGHVPAGIRAQALVGNIDIAPTVLEAAGLAKDGANMDGRSLIPVAHDGARPHSTLYAETYMPADSGFTEMVSGGDGPEIPVGVRRYGLLSPPWKYVVTEPVPIYGADTPPPPDATRKVERRDLFNLLLDPTEDQSVMQSEQQLTALLQATLADVRRGADARAAEKVHVTDEHLEKLRSLGYVQ